MQKLLAVFLAATLITCQVRAQQPAPPPTFDNFLDEDDFDAPPVGTPQAPRPSTGSGAQTAPTQNPFPPNGIPGFPGINAEGGGEGTSRTGAKPQARRNRKETVPAVAKKKVESNADKDITDENYPDLIDSFDYPNAEIADVVKAISELTGKNFIVDPQIKGKVTIIAPTRITVAEAYKAFLSTLAIHGFTIVPSGKFLKIKQAQNAIKDNLDTYSGSFAPNTDNMITRIIQLRYISAKDVVNNLGPILQSRLGELRPYDPTNTLIISDYGSNIERIMKILRQLDVPGFEEQLEVIRIKYAKASELAKTVDQIINKGKSNPNQSGGGFASGIPRFNPVGGGGNATSGDAYSLVIPDERTNTLIVVGNNQGIDKIRKLVRKLDFRIKAEENGGVYVYYVRFGDASKIATTLAGLAQNSATTPATNPFGAPAAPQKTAIFGGDVKVVAEATTNSLVVTASKQDYEVVQNILAKLDVPRDQVYVEGIIMELNVNSLKNWGISYYNLPVPGTFAGRQGFSSSTDNFGAFATAANDRGAILGFGNSSTTTITPPGGTAITIPNILGFINFLSGLTDTNILSTPQIVALDNEEAEIEVGDNVPVGTSQVVANGQTSQSQERRDLTIKLNIKPHISPGSDTMRLEITQAIQGIGSETAIAKNLSENAVSFSKRNTKTSVIARDKETIVLGGLIRDSNRTIVTKIPLLGDIPILGWLFKGKNVETKKLNLMMFLTPTIVRTSDAAGKLVKEKMRERTNFIERNLGGRDTQGENIDSLKLEKNGKLE